MPARSTWCCASAAPATTADAWSGATTSSGSAPRRRGSTRPSHCPSSSTRRPASPAPPRWKRWSATGRPWRIVCSSGSLSGLRAAALAGLGVTVHARGLLPDGLVEMPAAYRLPDLGDVDFVVLGSHASRTRAGSRTGGGDPGEWRTAAAADPLSCRLPPTGRLAAIRPHGTPTVQILRPHLRRISRGAQRGKWALVHMASDRRIAKSRPDRRG